MRSTLSTVIASLVFIHSFGCRRPSPINVESGAGAHTNQAPAPISSATASPGAEGPGQAPGNIQNGAAAIEAASFAKSMCQGDANLASLTDSNSRALLQALRIINVLNYTHKRQKPSDPNQPPPPPPKGTHPYEWDSLRTSEEMLLNRDGGSCGTHGLSLAAMLQALGVPQSDVSLLGAVQVPDYLQFCKSPGQSWDQSLVGPNGQVSDQIGAGGHVFLLVKLGSGWVIVNTTHNPATLRNLPLTRPVACQFALKDFEMMPISGGPEEFDKGLAMNSQPKPIQLDKFPSLVALMQAAYGSVPAMFPFARWSLSTYPIHTFKQRLNIIASGNIDNPTCRFNIAPSR